MANTQLVMDLITNDKTKGGFDSASRNAEEMASKWSSAGAVAGGVLGGIVASKAIDTMIDFGNESVNAASDLSETMNKSKVIFGDNEQAVEKWASNSAKTVGLAKGAALEAASSFGNMFQQLGFAGGQATDMSTQVVQLAADLGSFNNLGTDEVMDMLSGAFRGEYDSLQRLIPNINAARVEQEAMTATGKTSADQLTAQEKAAATLAIVQRDGSAAANDFAETSNGLANKQKIAAASMSDLKAQIGEQLLPAMNAITEAGLRVTSWMTANPEATKAIGIGIGVLAVALGIATVAQWAMNSALLASPITWIILAIAALIAIIVLLVTHWDAVKRAGAAAWDWIKGAWSSAGDFFGRIGDSIRGAFKSAFNSVASTWNNTVGRLSWSVPSWIPLIGGKTLSVPNIPMMFGGGTVTRAGLAMVGEQGAEVVELNAGDRVWPHGTGPAGSGVSIGAFYAGGMSPDEVADALAWEGRR